LATSNKDFRIKNGLIVDGDYATVNGNDVLTTASSINDLNDVVITDPSTGQVIKWNGTAWVNDTDDTGEGGAGNSFTTVSANGTSLVADSSTDTLTITPGKGMSIVGDETSDTVTFSVDYAEKTYYLVRNNTGSTIPKGTLVSASGAEPSGRIDIAPHETTGLQDSELRVMGMVTENISNGVNGNVISFGTLTGIDTRGDTTSSIAVGDETWAEGDILYAHPTVAGKLTNVRPQHDLAVAFITVRHASTGQIAIRIVPGNNHLEWLHDVAIDGTPADNEVLAYSSENGVWINQTATETGLVAEGDARLTDSRTPTAHATSHGSSGTDPIEINQSQVANLTTDLGSKLALAGGTMTGKITLDGDPTQALHAVTKQYVDNVEAGIIARPQVRAATTANLPANYSNGTLGVGSTLTSTSNGAFPLIDNVALTTVNGARGILVKNQTNAAHNGRYNLTTQGDSETPWVLTRCGLCDEADEIPGSYIFVTDGDINSGTGWVQNVADPATFTVGTDNISVFQFSSSGTTVAGTNITIDGGQISVVDDPTFAGTVTGPRFRLTSTSEFDVFEDDHAFQVGPSNGEYLIIDSNDISTFQGGVGLAPELYINRYGGDVEIGNSLSQIILEGATSASKMFTTNDGITNARAKPALITSGYNSISGGPQQDSRLIMSATSTANTPLTGTCTISIASPAVITRTSHGHANGSFVYFTTTGALPTGLAINTGYYVVNAATNTFQVSATLGGTAINTSGTQSGTHTVLRETAPRRRPDGTALVVGDIWLGFV
jgi:hypothetical protein